MKIVVPIHQIFDPRQIRVSSQGRVVTEGVSRVIEPASRAALEEALRLKDEAGATVDVLALGGAAVEESLREAQAIGADLAYLVSDSALNGGDAGADAYALSVAVRRIGEIDLVICGDGGAISGPMLAEFLGVPQLTDILGLSVSADGLVAGDQRLQGGIRRVSAPAPVVVTIAAGTSTPRYANSARVMSVFDEPTLTVWSAADLGLEETTIGSQGAKTQVRRTGVPDARVLGERLSGTPEEQAKSLVEKLRVRGLI